MPVPHVLSRLPRPSTRRDRGADEARLELLFRAVQRVLRVCEVTHGRAQGPDVVPDLQERLGRFGEGS